MLLKKFESRFTNRIAYYLVSYEVHLNSGSMFARSDDISNGLPLRKQAHVIYCNFYGCKKR